MTLKTILEFVAQVISIISVLIIIYGTVLGIIAFIANEFKKDANEGIRSIRVKFGAYLLLGLEFLICADIIKTIIEPGNEELLALGGIVIVRTLMSVFLNREIKELESQK